MKNWTRFLPLAVLRWRAIKTLERFADGDRVYVAPFDGVRFYLSQMEVDAEALRWKVRGALTDEERRFIGIKF